MYKLHANVLYKLRGIYNQKYILNVFSFLFNYHIECDLRKVKTNHLSNLRIGWVK